MSDTFSDLLLAPLKIFFRFLLLDYRSKSGGMEGKVGAALGLVAALMYSWEVTFRFSNPLELHKSFISMQFYLPKFTPENHSLLSVFIKSPAYNPIPYS